jgi:hypothetical protein
MRIIGGFGVGAGVGCRDALSQRAIPVPQARILTCGVAHAGDIPTGFAANFGRLSSYVTLDSCGQTLLK